MVNVVVVEQVLSPGSVLCKILLQDAGHEVTRAGLIPPEKAEDISVRVRQADVVVLSTTSHVISPERRQGFYEELRTYGKPIVIADTNLCESPIAVDVGDTYIATFSERARFPELLISAVDQASKR